MGPNIAQILENYWKRQRIVPKVGKYLGTEIGTGRGVTQGDPTSPMIFNIVVDVVVHVVLEEVCRPQEEQQGIRWASGERNLVFYADDGRISGQDLEWVQDTIMLMVTMFHQMGLDKKLEKPRQWYVRLGSSRGSGGSWHISGGRWGRERSTES